MNEWKHSPIKFPETLHNLMKKNYVSGADLARAAKISPPAVVKYLRGRIPRPEILSRIAVFFGCSIEYLLNGVGPEPSPINLTPPKTARQLFSLRLADLMEKKGITPTELTKRIGASRSMMSNWLRAKNLPGSPYSARLAGILGVTKDFLITGAEIERHEVIYEQRLTSNEERGGREKIDRICARIKSDKILAEKIIEYYNFLVAGPLKKSGSEGGSGHGPSDLAGSGGGRGNSESGAA